MMFQLLVRTHRPDSICFIPKYDADHSSERCDEKVVTRELSQKQGQISYVEDSRENRVEEVSWKQEPAQFYVVS